MVIYHYLRAGKRGRTERRLSYCGEHFLLMEVYNWSQEESSSLKFTISLSGLSTFGTLLHAEKF